MRGNSPAGLTAVVPARKLGKGAARSLPQRRRVLAVAPPGAHAHAHAYAYL
jgi:hypothetical protein